MAFALLVNISIPSADIYNYSHYVGEKRDKYLVEWIYSKLTVTNRYEQNSNPNIEITQVY